MFFLNVNRCLTNLLGHLETKSSAPTQYMKQITHKAIINIKSKRFQKKEMQPSNKASATSSFNRHVNVDAEHQFNQTLDGNTLWRPVPQLTKQSGRGDKRTERQRPKASTTVTAISITGKILSTTIYTLVKILQ